MLRRPLQGFGILFCISRLLVFKFKNNSRIVNCINNGVKRKMKSFILIILLFSCGQKNKTDQHDRNETVMSKFKLIDKKLKDLAEKLKAKVAKDGSGYYVDGV